ncbi:substrate-binding domain-containing protein [Caldicellulosiruptoraceae bacterium PP1]
MELIYNNNSKKLPSEIELMRKFNVSRQTIRKAYDILKEKGFINSKQGRGYFKVENIYNSKINKKDTIAIILPFYNNYIFPEILQGIQDELEDYYLYIRGTNNSVINETKIIKEISENDFIKGIIIEPTLDMVERDYEQIKIWNKLTNRQVPIVTIDSYYKFIDNSYVILDDHYGMKLAIEFLVNLNHKVIGGIFPITRVTGIRRKEGYRYYLKKYGIYDIKYELDIENIMANNNEYLNISNATEIENQIQQCFEYPIDFLKYCLKNILNDLNKATAWICFNDMIALILIDALREKGLSVPNDVSVIGFDDSIFSNISEIKLTTIWHPKYFMGKKAGQILKKLLSKRITKEKEIIKPRLIIRDSAAKNI